MALQWILGPAGSGKTTYMMEAVAARLKENPRRKIIMMVPEQATFQYQDDLLQNYGLEGFGTLEVLSFQRLAKRVMQQVGGSTLYTIDGLGKRMLLRRILQENKADYPYLEKSIDRAGYLKELGDMIQELKRYRVTPEELLAVADAHDRETSAFGLKLGELSRLYKAYDDILQGDRIDFDDRLNYLAHILEQNRLFEDTEFWVDDFYDFTPQEYAVLALLMGQAREMHIALCYEAPVGDPSRDGLFAGSGRIMKHLNILAGEGAVDVLSAVVMTAGKRWEKAPELKQLEQQYFSLKPEVWQAPVSRVALQQAQNRLSEVDGVARTIRELCRTEGYRYSDFGVLTRSEQYDALLEQVFHEYDIPCFLDEKAAMGEHPLTAFLTALMDVMEQNWTYAAVFRMLKTGLLSMVITREEADRLENYVLRYGIQGSSWYRQEDWHWKQKPEDPEAALADALRRKIAMPVRRLQLAFGEPGPVGDFIRGIYDLLEEFRVPEALALLSSESETFALMEQAQLHSQIWSRMAELFDQMEDMLGDSRITLKDFGILMGTAFENLTPGMLPSGVDRVFAGAVSHSRCGNIKVAFVLGLNEGVFPQKVGEDTFFGDRERRSLAAEGIALGSDAAKKRQDEQFLVYLAMTRPSEKIYFSYSISDSDGKALRPSEVVGALGKLYSQLVETYVQWPPLQQEAVLPYLNHPRKALGLLGRELQQTGEPAELWYGLGHYFAGDRDPLYEAICASLRAEETAEDCEFTDTGLFEDPLYISVSGLEKYRQCPYGYFLNYGLKLQPRAEYEMEAVDLGSFYHAAMELFTNRMLADGLTWQDMDEDSVLTLMHQVVDELAPGLQNEILMSTGRYRYIKGRIQKTLDKSAVYLLEHGRKGSFMPVKVEADFGYRNSEIPAFQVDLSDGARLLLRGKIDRVEEAVADNRCYLRVVDYKSGKVDLPLQDIYYGVKIQLLTYLQVLLEHRRKQAEDGVQVLPAAVLYYYFRGDLIAAKEALSADAAMEQHRKNRQADGLVVADPEGILLGDGTLTDGKGSGLLPLKLRAGKSDWLSEDYTGDEPEDVYDVFTRNSSVVSPEQMDMLGAFTLRRIRQLGEDIHRGYMPVRPYRAKGKTACKYCDYGAICRIGTRDVQKLSPMVPGLSEEEIWQRIERELLEDADRDAEMKEGGVTDAEVDS